MKYVNFVFMLLPFTAGICHAQRPDDCSWESTGKSRKAVKLRTTNDGASYTNFNSGQPVTLDQWFEMTCKLDALVPEKLPDDSPIAGAETVRVTIRGYLLAARFERDDDHDVHVELGATPHWHGPHIVLEMSAGPEYCKAREALWRLVLRDGCKGDQCFLRKPVEIDVSGFVLIGNPPKDAPRDYCNAKVSRGMRKGKEESQVRGLWRLQPVFSVKESRAHRRGSRKV
jgi:hypothetical protein